MDNILIDLLHQFYKDNETFLELKIDFDNWKINDEIVFSTNKMVRGKVDFSTKRVLYSKIPHVLTSLLGSKSYDGWTMRNSFKDHEDHFSHYYDEKPKDRYGKGEYWFPSCSNGKKLFSQISNFTKNYIEQEKILKDKLKKVEEKMKFEKLLKDKKTIISQLDKDGNGEVDVIEGNDFNQLFKKHQNLIKEIDKKHIQEFVKVSSYLKTKKNNIQLIFKSIKDTPDEQTLNQYVEILKDDIHSYNLILFNSLNMIVSLVEDDTITFYEIHEMFDNLNIFDSKHERDVSQKLNNIGDGLKELMYSIQVMGRNIEHQMGELTYVTEQSNQQLENQLQSINSSIDTNNLLTGINAYQTYKLRKGS